MPATQSPSFTLVELRDRYQALATQYAAEGKPALAKANQAQADRYARRVQGEWV